MLELDHPPIIGITAYGRQESGDFYLPGRYIESVRLAGGVPILLPPGETNVRAVLDLVDGLLLSGGGDIDPSFYGGSEHPTIYTVDPERDKFELALSQAAMNEDTPVLGICRGLQVAAVAGGGDLIVHLPDEFGEDVLHRKVEPDGRRPTEHPVLIDPGSLLAEILGVTEITVVSWHHQAARDVPAGWRMVAQAPDGVIEAIEHTDHPWAISVQWHPELAPEDPFQQRLMRALVEASHAHRLKQPGIPFS